MIYKCVYVCVCKFVTLRALLYLVLIPELNTECFLERVLQDKRVIVKTQIF